jgi:hypothetical protein
MLSEEFIFKTAFVCVVVQVKRITEAGIYESDVFHRTPYKEKPTQLRVGWRA